MFAQIAPDALEKRLFFCDEIYYALFWNHLSVYTNAFPEICQMRTGIKPHFVSRTLENGSQGMTYGTLSVCAAYVNGAVAAVRMSVPSVQGICVGQSFFISARPDILE